MKSFSKDKNSSILNKKIKHKSPFVNPQNAGSIDVYERYYSKIQTQKRLINKKNFTYRHLIEVIDKHVKGKKFILDIGSGTGTLSLYLAAKGHKVIGIDTSERAIETAIENAKKLGLRKKVCFQKMHFPNEYPYHKFDFALCTEVIEHIKDDKKAIKRIFKLIKKNGIVVISVPSKSAPLYRWGFCENFDRRVGHLRRYTSKELISKCKSGGFDILSLQKTEGLLRNLFFVSPILGKFVKFFNKIGILSDSLALLDSLFIKIFRESQLIVTLKRK